MSVIKFGRRPGSRRSTNTPPTYEETYMLSGIFDAGTAKGFARSLIPLMVVVDEGIIFLQDIEVAEQGFQIYHCRARYAEGPQAILGNVGFSFNTTGGQFHITHSRQSVAMYTVAGLATPDNNRAINVDNTGNTVKIEGTDIIIPALKLSYTFKHPAGIINEAFAVNVARATSCVNSVAFRGFQPGEMIFLGGEGSSGTGAETEVTYHFAAEENLTGLIFQAFDKDNPSATISGVDKQGQDLLWIESVLAQPAAAGGGSEPNQPVTKPKKIHIERLYRRINFATTLGWGG